jgi:hypothetical protein
MVVLGWVIPAVLAWVAARIPIIRKMLVERPILLTLCVCILVSALSSATSLLLYDRFVINPKVIALVPSGVVAVEPEAGSCPDGFVDKSTFIIARWKAVADRERYINPRDIAGAGVFQNNPDWKLDHAKLCVHQQ